MTTKQVWIRLTALTRVEYTELAEVPADLTAEELQALVDQRYETVSGDEFKDDPRYFVRSRCHTLDAKYPRHPPTLKVTRAADGTLNVGQYPEGADHDS